MARNARLPVPDLVVMSSVEQAAAARRRHVPRFRMGSEESGVFSHVFFHGLRDPNEIEMLPLPGYRVPGYCTVRVQYYSTVDLNT